MEQKFIEQLSEIFEMEGKEVSTEDTFRDYDNWDSITNLNIIAMLDSEFGVMIESSEFNKLITVGELLEEVKKRMV